MVKYRSSITIPYSISSVWNLMSDWRNLSIWDINITKSVYASGFTTPGVGTKYDCAFNINGRDVGVDYECIEFAAPHKAKFLGLATLFRSEDSIECETVEGGTKLTAEFNLRFRGVLSPLSFVMDGTMQKTGPVVMKDIEAFLKKELSDTEE